MRGTRGVSFVVAVVTVGVLAVGCTSPGVVHFPTGSGPAVVTTEDQDVVGPIHFRGRDLIDATGRVVLIHGVNSVEKSAPFISPLTDGWLGPADFASFRSDGLNGVRLGVWAAALMPSPGVIDTAYLDQVQTVVDQLAAHHLWVLLDFHQDVFSGMPAWATTAAAGALSAEVPAAVAAIGWAAAYVSPRSIQQWEDWWSNATIDGSTRGVVDAFGDGIAAVADRFHGSSNVIGLELLNEPFAGSPFFDCAVSCGARYQVVAQRFSQLTQRVRTVAPDMPVWWEPFTIGAPYPGTPSPGANIGYSFHAYCLGTDGGQPVAPDAVSVAFCDSLFTGIFDAADHVGGTWNAPAMLTEFGASSSPLNATEGAKFADQHLVSWFHWHHPPEGPEVVRTQLVRTYAQATAGEPQSQHFDPATGSFDFTYVPDASVTAPTSIVVPATQYPDGYDAVVNGGSVTSAANAGRLTVVADPGVATVTVHVARHVAA